MALVGELLATPRDSGKEIRRVLLATLVPLAAFGLQWLFWAAIQPYVWFLFFPAVFFSSWIGGLWGGLIATFLSTGLVWYHFIPPAGSFEVQSPLALVSIAIFVGMGILFSLSHDRLRRANRRASENLDAARSANEQLQAANAKVTQLYEQTRELDRLRTRFFANVSHELRTPLTLLLGPIANRLSRVDPASAERHDLEIMQRNARLLYRHVSDLLDVSKLDAGRMLIHYTKDDLSRLARRTALHFEGLAADRHVRFEIDVPDQLMAEVDTEKCERIVLNLLSNAFKFTPEGGAVRLSLAAEAETAVLTVDDTGPGVPEALRETVFEPFRQGEGDTGRRFGGTGLGLAIVRDFVGLHRGTASIGESPGGGARLIARLPLTAPPGAVIRSTGQPLDPEIRRQAVDELEHRDRGADALVSCADPRAPLLLLVEDNPDMSDYLARALGAGYRVVTAADGEEGVRKAVELVPDLIVSDVMMPRLDGAELVAAIRARPELTDVPIVMLSAKADDELRVRLLKVGAQDYLTKPFLPEELRARVDGLVAKRRKNLAEILRFNASLERRVEERQQAERDLRESEERFRRVVETAPEAIFIRIGDRFAYVNAAALRLFGAQGANELLGQPVMDRFHPDHRSRVRERIRLLDQEQQSTLSADRVLLRLDGTPVHVMISAVPFNYQHQPSSLVFARDITERRRAEDQLRKLSRVVEQGPAVVVITNCAGDIEYVNPRFTELTGYAPQEVLGRNPRILKSGEMPADLYRHLWDTITHGGEWRGQFHNRRKNGELFWESASISPIVDDAGRITHFVGIKEDITERKRFEAERVAMEAQLRQQQKLESIGTLASGVAHEINNPITGIMNYAQLIQDQLPPESPLTEYTGEILHETDRVTTIVRNLLTFARSEKQSRSPTRIIQIVEATLSLARAVIRHDRISLTVQVPEDLPVLHCRSQQVQQVLMNLITNARDALNERYPGSAADKVMMISAAPVQRDGRAWLRISVEDHGTGITPEVRERMFDPFFTTKPRDRGTGLGLSISHGIAKEHGGALVVESVPGSFTRVSLELPLA